MNFTSCTDSWMVCERSYRVSTFTAAGSWRWIWTIASLTRSATSTVLVPGWRWIASTMARVPLNQLAALVSCTLSMTRPRSPRRTGAPSRMATISGRKAAALSSWPSASTA